MNIFRQLTQVAVYDNESYTLSRYKFFNPYFGVPRCNFYITRFLALDWHLLGLKNNHFSFWFVLDVLSIQNRLIMEEIKHFKKSSLPPKHVQCVQEILSPDAFTVQMHSHWIALLTNVDADHIIQVPLQTDERGRYL